LTGVISVEGYDNGRLELYAEALSDFLARPLTGHGFSQIRDALNIYLQLLQAGGLIALSAFSLFTVGSLRLGWRLAHEPVLSGSMRSLAVALTVSVLVWLQEGLVQNAIYDRYLYVPAGLLLAMRLFAVRHYKPVLDVGQSTSWTTRLRPGSQP
jgi:hypothetical protein